MNKLLSMALFLVVNISQGIEFVRSSSLDAKAKAISDKEIVSLDNIINSKSEFDINQYPCKIIFLKLANSLCNDKVASLFKIFLSKCPNIFSKHVYVQFCLLEALDFRRKDIVLYLLSNGSRFDLEHSVTGARYVYNLLSKHSMADIIEITNNAHVELSQDILCKIAKSWSGNIKLYIAFGESIESIQNLPQFKTGYDLLIYLNKLDCDFRENRMVVTEIIEIYRLLQEFNLVSDIYRLMANK